MGRTLEAGGQGVRLVAKRALDLRRLSPLPFPEGRRATRSKLRTPPTQPCLAPSVHRWRQRCPTRPSGRLAACPWKVFRGSTASSCSYAGYGMGHGWLPAPAAPAAGRPRVARGGSENAPRDCCAMRAAMGACPRARALVRDASLVERAHEQLRTEPKGGRGAVHEPWWGRPRCPVEQVSQIQIRSLDVFRRFGLINVFLLGSCGGRRSTRKIDL